MKITVIGAGYVGLVTGTCFADLGNTVTCVEVDLQKLDQLRRGEVPFFEPSLSEKMKRSLDAGRLHFTNDLEEAISDSAIVFSAVGTPPKANGEADLQYVFQVVDAVIDLVLKTNDNTQRILITKSTVPVGTGRKIQKRIQDAGLSEDKLVNASNPEFLREGSAVHDFFHPDRIVLGGYNKEALDALSTLYDPIYRTDVPIVRTDLETAELSKYASNAFLATKISFINEMANLCELMGANVKDISKIMGMDGRIGKYFLHPGPGYGGSCFPKDTKALIHTADGLNYDLKSVKAAESVNAAQKEKAAQQIIEACGGSVDGKTIAILGLAFKPNTDDIREAPSIHIMNTLLAAGATCRVYDPEAMNNIRGLFNDRLSYCDSSYDAALGSDAIALVTEWNTFRELNFEKLLEQCNTPRFLDFRGVYKPAELVAAGFDAYVVGEPFTTRKEAIA